MRRKVFTHSMTRKRQRWQPFQAAAVKDLERRKVFTHAMTRKRQRWQPPQAAAAGRRQRRRRAHEKNQRKCVMSGVEGALSRRTPRPQAAAARAAAGHGGPPNELKTQCSTCVRLARPAQRVRGRPQAAAARRPRQRWPPPQSGHPAAGRPHVAAAGRPQAVAAGRPQGGRRRTATAGQPQAATAGRHRPPP